MYQEIVPQKYSRKQEFGIQAQKQVGSVEASDKKFMQCRLTFACGAPL